MSGRTSKQAVINQHPDLLKENLKGDEFVDEL